MTGLRLGQYKIKKLTIISINKFFSWSDHKFQQQLNFRGYSGKKLEDNIQCEIFETLLEEAQSSYKPEIIQELHNNTEDQLSSNVDTIVEWIQRWKEENI